MSEDFPALLGSGGLLEVEVPPHIHQFSDIEGDVGDLEGVGDIRSFNWDGGSDLSSADSVASAGYFLDASAGSWQTMGDYFVGGDVTLVSGGAINSGPSGSPRVIIDFAKAGVLDFWGSGASDPVSLNADSGSLQLGGDGLTGGLLVGGSSTLLIGGANDADTYLSTDAGDQLNLHAGGVEMLRLAESTNDQVFIGGTSGVVGLGHLSDTDTGLQWTHATGDLMSIIVGGVNMMQFSEAATDTITVGAASVVNLRMGSSGGFLGFGGRSDLTISGGVVTITSNNARIDTEGSAATDDLDTINGGAEGDIIIITSTNNNRDITCKDGTGNLALAGDFTLAHTRDTLTLLQRVDGTWLEISRSTNT